VALTKNKLNNQSHFAAVVGRLYCGPLMVDDLSVLQSLLPVHFHIVLITVFFQFQLLVNIMNSNLPACSLPTVTQMS
jgi:hypothetical protein